MVRRLGTALAALAALASGPARAHEVLHRVERGRALAVRAFEPDGTPLAGELFEVYAPAGAARPWAQGRTDPDGWLAFVPDRPGGWRVRVVEAGGHGLDVAVEVPVPGGSPPAAAEAPPSLLSRALRLFLGAAAVLAVFAAAAAWRRRGKPG